MKKVALITTNKILAQSLAVAMKTIPELNFDFYLFLNYQQAILDAQVFEINVALIDVTGCEASEKKTPFKFLEALHKSLPNCHLMLLVSQEDTKCRELAEHAKKNKLIEDFVFYDASLQYLMAKLESI